MVTSPAVLEELDDGPPAARAAWHELIRDLPVLAIVPAIPEILDA